MDRSAYKTFCYWLNQPGDDAETIVGESQWNSGIIEDSYSFDVHWPDGTGDWATGEGGYWASLGSYPASFPVLLWETE
jgi:hypothetical protein